MTAPARRHPRVVNLDEVEPMERTKGRFGAKAKRLGAPAGAKEIGFNWMELKHERTARVIDTRDPPAVCQPTDLVTRSAICECGAR